MKRLQATREAFKQVQNEISKWDFHQPITRETSPVEDERGGAGSRCTLCAETVEHGMRTVFLADEEEFMCLACWEGMTQSTDAS